jgi:drug/metabolite transporter (DMT)-like permease
MGVVAVGLVLFSALLHASWNALAKRSADPLAFLFAIGVSGLVLYTIPMSIMLARHGLPAAGVPYLVVSGLVEVIYTFTLAAAYRHGALSLTYPVARGTGVVLVPLLAIPLLGERPTTVALLGVAGILCGLLAINVLSLGRRLGTEVEQSRRGLVFALLTGFAITTYSLIDKVGVSHVHPLIYVYGLILIQVLVIAPYVLARRRAAIAHAWKSDRRAVIAAGAFNMTTYLIVLAAMSLAGSNVSYIIPLRETSIVFATFFGVVLLGERIGAARIAGCAMIAFGVLAIALGG